MDRNQQIKDELTQLGLDPSDDAVKAVKDYLRANGRATVPTACKRLAEAYRAESQKGHKSNGQLTQKLAQVANQLKGNIKTQVVTTAVKGALDDFRRGDFGDLSQLTLDDLDQAIDVEYSLLNLEDLDPKYALPSRDYTPLPSGENRLSLTAGNQEGAG